MNAQIFGWLDIIRLGLIQACLGAVVVVMGAVTTA